MNRTLRHELALVLGGAIFGVVGTDLTALLPISRWRTVTLTFGALLLIMYGFVIPQHARTVLILAVRRKRWRRPRIGILAGLTSTTGDRIVPMSTEIPPAEWKEELRKAAARRGVAVRIKLTPALARFDSFDALVNPFGSTYPESSFQDFPIYRRLLDYIREGGLFVNVADIPTYFAFNAHLRRSIDRTPAVYSGEGQPVRFFERVPLMEELAIRVRNYESLGPPTVSPVLQAAFASCGPVPPSLVITRAAIVEGNVKPIIAALRLNQDNATPLFLCPYGDGRVLCSLSFLSNDYSANKAVVPFLADLTIHAITSDRHESP
jgi:hypothetical protein